MVDDAGSAQALALLGELYGHVDDISHKLEAAESRNRRARARGNTRKDPIAGILRRELYEAHRLIDGLYRRYPQTAPESRRHLSGHHRRGVNASPPSAISS
ncbi:MAG TPA: hypothetical protein VET27_00065 [Mycobacterium sp.]|nr:hypothetical protein [Mycobacterium sp.]